LRAQFIFEKPRIRADREAGAHMLLEIKAAGAARRVSNDRRPRPRDDGRTARDLRPEKHNGERTDNLCTTSHIKDPKCT
jgi:hypothetical protein